MAREKEEFSGQRNGFICLQLCAKITNMALSFSLIVGHIYHSKSLSIWFNLWISKLQAAVEDASKIR